MADHQTADGTDTITVRVPIAFVRRGGRKTVTTPSAAPFAPPHSHINSAVVKAIARAFRWRKLIETGVYASIQDIAAKEQINASYVGRILRLTLLAPDIVAAILDSRQDAAPSLESLMRPFSVNWCRQHRPPTRKFHGL